MYELNVVVAHQSILGYFCRSGATNLNFIVKGANAVSSSVMRSVISETHVRAT